MKSFFQSDKFVTAITIVIVAGMVCVTAVVISDRQLAARYTPEVEVSAPTTSTAQASYAAEAAETTPAQQQEVTADQSAPINTAEAATPPPVSQDALSAPQASAPATPPIDGAAEATKELVGPEPTPIDLGHGVFITPRTQIEASRVGTPVPSGVSSNITRLENTEGGMEVFFMQSAPQNIYGGDGTLMFNAYGATFFPYVSPNVNGNADGSPVALNGGIASGDFFEIYGGVSSQTSAKFDVKNNQGQTIDGYGNLQVWAPQGVLVTDVRHSLNLREAFMRGNLGFLHRGPGGNTYREARHMASWKTTKNPHGDPSFFSGLAIIEGMLYLPDRIAVVNGCLMPIFSLTEPVDPSKPEGDHRLKPGIKELRGVFWHNKEGVPCLNSYQATKFLIQRELFYTLTSNLPTILPAKSAKTAY